MAENERLLLAIQLRQHRLKLALARHPGEHAIDVPLVIQQAGYLGADLAHHFLIDAAGSLVDHQQSDIILPHLAGDGTEYGLPGKLMAEEPVRLLNGYDQRPGFSDILPHRLLHPLSILGVNSPGEKVRH